MVQQSQESTAQCCAIGRDLALHHELTGDRQAPPGHQLNAIEAIKMFTTRFGFQSTAAQVLEGIDLSGKRAIVTGASSGIGIETARALAGAGAEVTLAVRDVEAGHRVAAQIREAIGDARLQVRRLDLSDLNTVRAFTDGW